MKYVALVALLAFACLATAQRSNLPLDEAARKGNLNEVIRLIEQGADPNELNDRGFTALTGASTYGAGSPVHTNIVHYLVTHGADVNKRVRDGTTALYEASFWGHTEIVRVLIAAGARMNSARDSGYTPLHAAANGGHLGVVRLLVAAGADLNLLTRKHGLTALHLASGTGHKEVVNFLVASGARTDLKNARGESYLEVSGRVQGLVIPQISP